MSLEKELEGVITSDLESPSETDNLEDQVDDQELDGADDNDDTDDSDGGGADDGTAEKSGRSVENVRREVLRKQTESERRILAQFNQLHGLVQSVLETKTAGKKSEDSLDTLPVAQLAGMRDQVPEDKRAEFDAYLLERRVTDKVSQTLTQHQEDQKYKSERERANGIAVERFPQLRDKFSPLFTEVDRRLRSQDANYIKYNPRIVLNITEDVAAELGLRPRHTDRARHLTRPASTETTKPARITKGSDNVIPDDEFDTIARNLSGGRVKFDAEARKRIKERGKLYKEHMSGKE